MHENISASEIWGINVQKSALVKNNCSELK